jgi:AraC-like DNA-binding protein
MKETGFAWPARLLPRIFTAGYCPLADRDYQVRYLSRTHALHLYDYACTMRLGNSEYTIGPGCATLTPASVGSSYHVPKPGHHWCVHFHVVQNRPAGAPRPALAMLPLHTALEADGAEAASRMAEIVRLHTLATSAQAAHREVASAAASAAFLELLLWLSLRRGASASSAPRADKAVERAAALLESRLLDPPTIPELSEMVELTQNYLARKFRKRFGVTIQRYILTRRIEYARLLLSSTDAPIARIAQRVGLPDPQHFNKQFRRVMKMSPSEWRQAGARG